MEEGACAAGEEILVDFLKGDAWVEVDVLLLLLGLFEDELGHELAEEIKELAVRESANLWGGIY